MKFRFLMVVWLLLSGGVTSAQNKDVWMYGWGPADSQERYDYRMKQLYVSTPYLQDDYERDVLGLYAGLQYKKKISEYCQRKVEDGRDFKLAYLAWGQANRDYVEFVNSLWDKLAEHMDAEKKRKFLEGIQKKDSSYLIDSMPSEESSCKKFYSGLVLKDEVGKIAGREAQEKKFSDSYRNIDFFLHPEKKEALRQLLKAQLDTALVAQKACKKSGGTWKPVGRGQRMSCITRYPDAGKSCTDSSQCKGGCVLHHGKISDDKVTGQCKEDDDSFGCPIYVQNGKASSSVICTD